MKNLRSNGFVESAAFEDSGQSAAIERLGMTLGELASSLLGPGQWEPTLSGFGPEHEECV